MRVRVRVVARNSIMVFSVIGNFGNWKTLSDFLGKSFLVFLVFVFYSVRKLITVLIELCK